MPRKPKFRPEIRRIKLNPEQAVLECVCHTGRRWLEPAYHWGQSTHTSACQPDFVGRTLQRGSISCGGTYGIGGAAKENSSVSS